MSIGVRCHGDSNAGIGSNEKTKQGEATWIGAGLNMQRISVKRSDLRVRGFFLYKAFPVFSRKSDDQSEL